ncbi:MAG: 2-oxoacid:acceptor oxidoreductase family protein [Anaerolineae bacterium]|nr:2-oxoacid:acceptor oxidoreductase family protein [Anaerolineae bacterium]MDQ7035065.1 2-oxoacid:acceptor oxidoreductase family protein [Anaerolineae bacterium]
MAKSNNTKQVPYPGIPTTSDGAGTVVWVDTNITHGSCAYPITSSTTMGVAYEMAVANGKHNLWGDKLIFLQPESEHSSASAAEGFAASGGRVSNFTSGQGLVLMKEVLYTISGKRLPAVFHIGARAITSHSLNVHAGHDDVMSVADTGWAMMMAKTAQEAGDFALIARRAAENSLTPFLSVQDGFLTTHTVEDVLLSELEFMRDFVGNPNEKLVNLMDTKIALMSGVVQNQDSYMKGKIAQRLYYDRVEAAILEAMEEFGRQTGREYSLTDSYRMDDAEVAIVGMGSMMETCEATIDYMRDEQGIKVGYMSVSVFRPFPAQQIVDALKHVHCFTVVERMDNPMAESNPLTMEIKSAFADAMMTGKIDRIPVVYSASAGLGSRDVRPGDFTATTRHMLSGSDQRYFVLGIDHELALSRTDDPDVRPLGSFSMRGHSVGGFGSVTTNKIIADVVGELFHKHVQAYPKYGSEKKGLPTTYYLTVADGRIRMHAELNQVDFIPLNDINAFYYSNPLAGLEQGGTIFINVARDSAEEVWSRVPPNGKLFIRDKKARVVALDAARIARDVATDPSLTVRMQGIVLLGIFLRITPFASDNNLSRDDLKTAVEKALRNKFGKRGEQIVQDNLIAVMRGYDEVFDIPPDVIAQDLEVPGLFRHDPNVRLFEPVSR